MVIFLSCFNGIQLHCIRRHKPQGRGILMWDFNPEGRNTEHKVRQQKRQLRGKILDKIYNPQETRHILRTTCPPILHITPQLRLPQNCPQPTWNSRPSLGNQEVTRREFGLWIQSISAIESRICGGEQQEWDAASEHGCWDCGGW